MKNRSLRLLIIGAVLFFQLPAFGQWRNFARDPQHTALSPVPSQTLNTIHWQTPVDLQPQYSGSSLLIHYGSPLVTPANTIIFPVKTTASGGFRIEAHNAANGNLIWSQNTDYVLPAHSWVPEVGPALTSGRVYYPGAGGTVYFQNSPDSPNGDRIQLAFYGLSQYMRNRLAFNQGLQISTPITADS